MNRLARALIDAVVIAAFLSSVLILCAVGSAVILPGTF